MRVQTELLVPSVQHAEETNFRAIDSDNGKDQTGCGKGSQQNCGTPSSIGSNRRPFTYLE